MLAIKRLYRPTTGMTSKIKTTPFVCGLGHNTAEGAMAPLLPVSPSQLEGVPGETAI